jgi:hypothetical protein
LEIDGFCEEEENPFGPVQEYVAPATFGVVRFSVDPSHRGLLLPAEGVAGVGFTVTVTVAGLLEQPLLATTVYVPAAASTTLFITGFCVVEVNPFGPLQEYVAPGIVSTISCSESPAHTGLLLDATGVAGEEFTVTLTVPALLVHPFTVTVSEYVPVSADVTFVIEGFCEEEVNAFGPVHEYVAPATAVVVRFSVAPTHNGLLLEGTGVAGIGLITTVVVPAGPVQPFTVTVTEYVPAAASVAPVTDVFCCVSVKPFGPVQLYVAPATFEAVRLKLPPSQIGPVLEAVGAAGVGLTVTVTVPALPVQPLTVIVSEYVPAAASVTPAMFGFCNEEENPFGPVQLYVAPATALVVRFNVPPVQTGLLLDGEGAAGMGLTTTAVVPTGLVQPLTVIVTE